MDGDNWVCGFWATSGDWAVPKPFLSCVLAKGLLNQGREVLRWHCKVSRVRAR